MKYNNEPMMPEVATAVAQVGDTLEAAPESEAPEQAQVEEATPESEEAQEPEKSAEEEKSEGGNDAADIGNESGTPTGIDQPAA